MAELTAEMDNRVHGDVFERLASVTSAAPAEVVRMAALRNAIAAAETAVTIAQQGVTDTGELLPYPDPLAVQAAENQRTAAEEAFVTYIDELNAAGTLEAAVTYVETNTPERPEVLAARAEQERLAAEAEARAAAEAARFVPQAEEAPRPGFFMNAEYALAGLLMEVHASLPDDPAAYADNAIISTLITAKAQGEDAYYDAAAAIVEQHYESGALDASLHDFRDSQRRFDTTMPVSPGESMQQHTYINIYLDRLAAIPATATNVPPSMAGLVALAHEVKGMMDAPAGTYTDQEIEARTYDYVQEGLRLDRQQVPVDDFLADYYPNTMESVAHYIAAVPEVAWNNPAIIIQSVENFAGGTAGLVGDVVDMVDAGTGWALRQTVGDIGSPKSWIGHGDVSYGDNVAAAVTGTLDFVTGTPEIRPGSNDEMVLEGTETALDGVLIAASLGTAGAAKVGVKTAVRLTDDAVDAAAVTVRAADGLAAPAAAAVTTRSSVSAIAGNLGQTLPRIIDYTEEAYMGTKNRFIRWLTEAFESSAAPAARTADAAVDVATPAAKTVEDLSAAMARRNTWAGSTYVSRAHDGLTARAALASEQGRTMVAAGYESMAMTMRTARAVSSGVVAAGASYLVADYASGEALSRGLAQATQALADSIREYSPEMADMLINDVAPAVAAAGVGILEQSYSSTKAYLGELTGLGADDPMVAVLADTYTSGPVAAALHAQGYEVDPVRLAEIYRESEGQENPGAFVTQKLQEEYDVPPQLMAGMQGYKPETPAAAVDAAADVATDAAAGITAAAPAVADGFRAATERYTAMLDWRKKIDDLATSMQSMASLSWLAPVVAVVAAIVGLIADFFKPDNADNLDVQSADGGEKIKAVANAFSQGAMSITSVIGHDGAPRAPITVDPLPGQAPRRDFGMQPAYGPQ